MFLPQTQRKCSSPAAVWLQREIALTASSVLCCQVCPHLLLQPWLLRVSRLPRLTPLLPLRGRVSVLWGLALLRRPPPVEVVDLEQAWTRLSLLSSVRLHGGLRPAQRAWSLVSVALSAVDLLAARSSASSLPTGLSQRGPQFLPVGAGSSFASGLLRAGLRLARCAGTLLVLSSGLVSDQVWGRSRYRFRLVQPDQETCFCCRMSAFRDSA